MEEYISTSEEQSIAYAKEISDKTRNGGIICIYGDLGSGKTFLSKHIAENMGIDRFSVKSPTYTYIREYRMGKKKLYHIDLYRLTESDDLLEMELEEIFEIPDNIVIIEWADRLKNKVPATSHKIYLEYINENTRKIKYEKNTD
ncbi:tRNA (adenosine(37)-N6)-threonylcarbamoyltransferase complex ATPase subunit type 1 TsaE [Candidatus Peregrinibacteria bacterium]|nr:tRNA (adenosine(37)-N6)-threonylcarbamoyltransferase complex ATPase subunit type 1 TsaE [Candidatus Peregrinibacteria bacterium]